MSVQQESNGKSSSPRISPPFIGLVVLLVVLAGLLIDTQTRADSDSFYGDIIRLESLAAKVHQSYVEEMNSKDLIDKAIDGMLSILDPHTAYFDEKEFEELRIHTEGKFGGLGIQIAIREKVLTVMTPIAGTPAARAGIQPGDQIVEIDGKPTKGIKLDEAVGKLRGEPQTQVKITIVRKSEGKPLPYTLTREVIKIKSVPFAGVISGSIGYVRLNQFSEETSSEVEKALKSLLAKNVKGIVLDLRANPGGLLPQAIEVSAKFLPRGSLVVSTRGRMPGQNREFSSSAPVIPGSLPIVVLVNGGSASASEIVAGAIQDWDRGVVLGDTTFGKGSVQTILPLDSSHTIKMTTAFYYTPSGRCINKPENGIRGKKPGVVEDGEAVDSAAVADSLKNKKTPLDTMVYKTKGGRIVHGGGGIVPDSVHIPPFFNPLILTLLSDDMFFRFSTIEHIRLEKKKIVIDENFKVNDMVMADFKNFLDSIKFKYRSNAQIIFEDFKKRVGVIDSVKDTAKTARFDSISLSAAEKIAVKDLSAKIEKILVEERGREFGAHDAEIRTFLREAMLAQVFGQDNEIVYRARLNNDTELKAAIDILGNPSLYSRLLKGK